jgi:hypothetical protein
MIEDMLKRMAKGEAHFSRKEGVFHSSHAAVKAYADF